MIILHKTKIGVIGLTFKYYDEIMPNLKMGREVFMLNVLKRLYNFSGGRIEFLFNKASSTRECVENAVSEYEVAGCEGLMVVFLTYTPSHVVLPALLKTHLPILLWNTQEAYSVNRESPAEITSDNHGVHGAQDLASVLKRLGIKFIAITSHWENDMDNEKLIDILQLFHAVKQLKGARIGLLGGPLQGMGDFSTDETKMLAVLGSELIRIPIAELVNILKHVDEAKAKEIVEKDRKAFLWDKSISDEERLIPARMECAVRQLIGKYRLRAWSQCFTFLEASPEILELPFLAASKLMADGFGYSAEGDIGAACGAILLNALAGRVTLSEMFTMDFKEGSLLMAHMGELNIGMARKGRPVRIIPKAQSNGKSRQLTPVFGLEPGEVTLISITTSRYGKFRIIATEGEIMDTEPNPDFMLPHYKFRPDLDLKEFLNIYMEFGGTHHQALAYGRWKETLSYIKHILPVEFVGI